MSTVAEIQSAIAKLPPEDFCAVHDWMTKGAQGQPGRMWTPEELEEGARRMLEEPDPVKADAIWEEVVAGFYGDPRA